MNKRIQYFIEFYLISKFQIDNYLPTERKIQFKINNEVYKQPNLFYEIKMDTITGRLNTLIRHSTIKLNYYTPFDNQYEPVGKIEFITSKNNKYGINGKYIIGNTITFCSTPEPDVIVNLANKNYDMTVEKIMNFIDQNDLSLVESLIHLARKAIS